MTDEHIISVSRTARVYTTGRLNPRTRYVWFVMHGYGQLAATFIRAFEDLDEQEHYIIAPEGLSRAYTGGKTGRPGASWMTSEMREEEIADYLGYLDKALARLHRDSDRSSRKLVVLGFSQGTATASRWVEHASVQPCRLVLVGGAPAHELMAAGSLQDTPMLFVHGQQDRLFGETTLQALAEDARGWNWDFRVLQHAGGHQLDREVVEAIAAFIDR